MSSLVKYRVHEFAKDFGVPSKEIITILTDYLTPPKNHMQVLTDEELNFLFDYVTQNNQIESIEEVFAETFHEVKPTEPETPPAVSEPKETKAAETVTEAAPSQTEAKPAASAPAADKPQTPPAAPVKPAAPTRTQPQVRIIDTRGATVDLGKYDERIENLVPDKAKNVKQGMEKFKKQPGRGRTPYVSNKRRQEEQDKMRRLREEMLKKQTLKVSIPDEISVGELASRLKKTGAEVVRQLMKLGIMASLSEIIDFDTASLVALEFGAKIEKEINVTIEERLIDDSDDSEDSLLPRDPVVVVMGHVDHGKTSLLDAIRETNVVSGEAGGITQHIGAHRVHIEAGDLTFLDTPGHAAFTSMRARGASITDIAILVVAADDGIMPQTIEAINHAKAASIPIIVAINKMDKPEANPDRIMQQLTEYELVPEEWGGETIVCKVSAATGEGIEHLLEMVILTSEMAELRANPDRAARGAVIEAKLDKGRGPVTTLLVQNGTLKTGDILIAGTSVGRVRAMTDDKGNKIDEAGPSMPVEVIGMAEVPGAGDIFHAVPDERMARELAEQRKQQEKDEQSRPVGQKISLDDIFSQIKEGQLKDLNIIVKADVQGSVEALRTSLEKLTNDEVRVRVIHGGVGAVSESDILLASTASAIVVGFNVRPETSARDSAARAGVEIRLYRIIYECLDEMEAAMKGLLDPKFEEHTLGSAEVRQVFKVTGVGTIAGSYVKEGKIVRSAKIRIVRDGIVVHEGELDSLKRFKDDAREVANGFECGIGIDRYNDIKEGDIIECFEMVEIER